MNVIGYVFHDVRIKIKGYKCQNICIYNQQRVEIPLFAKKNCTKPVEFPFFTGCPHKIC